MRIKSLITTALVVALGMGQPVFSQTHFSTDIIRTELSFESSDQPASYQISQAVGQSDSIELINKTGKIPALAIGMSIIPGLGQFYNGDFLAGALYLLATAGVLVLDGVMYANGATVNPVLIVLPGLSVASMVHAGFQTQEQNMISFKF